MENQKIINRESIIGNRVRKYTKFFKLSVQTEIFSLIGLETLDSKAESTNIGLKFPNSMLINGIAISLKDATTCQKLEIGK